MVCIYIIYIYIIHTYDKYRSIKVYCRDGAVSRGGSLRDRGLSPCPQHDGGWKQQSGASGKDLNK